MTEEAAAATRTSYKSFLTSELEAAESRAPVKADAVMFKGSWGGMVWPANSDAVRDPETGVDRETLVRVGRASVTVPDGFVRVKGGGLLPADHSCLAFRRYTPACSDTSTAVCAPWRKALGSIGRLLRYAGP